MSQHWLQRLDDLEQQQQLLFLEFQQRQQQLFTETQALREEVSHHCLATIANLAKQALVSAERASGSTVQLDTIMRLLSEPRASSRIAAYDFLRTLHIEQKEQCAKGRALLILRDLVVITVVYGQGAMNPQKLKIVLDQALQKGCGRHELDPVEQSQLTMAYDKVIGLGSMNLEAFAAKLRSPKMYGEDISQEQVEQLFVVYHACWRASPSYISINKGGGRMPAKRRSAASSSATMAEPQFAEPEFLRAWDEDHHMSAQAPPIGEPWWICVGQGAHLAEQEEQEEDMTESF